MKSALKKSSDCAKITCAGYTVKLKTDLATLLTLPPEETPAPFVFRESHEFNNATEPLFLAGFSNDWKKHIKTKGWLRSPENAHTWLGTCVRKDDEMYLTIRKGKLKQTQFKAAIKKNAALKKLTWHITEAIQEGEDDDLLNDDLHESDEDEPQKTPAQSEMLQQQAHTFQTELVDLLKQLKGATPVILGNVEQIAPQLYQIPNWQKYTNDKVEGYLEQVETFLAQQNKEDSPSLASELNRIHRLIEQEAAAFKTATSKEEKTAILGKIVKLLQQWDTTAESATPEDFTDEQRVEIPTIKAQIKKIAPNASIKEDSIPSATPEVAQEEPKQPIELQVTVHVHNLPTFVVSALDTDTVQNILDKVSTTNLQQVTALSIGGIDVTGRRGETLQQLGIQGDTDLNWEFEPKLANITTWANTVWVETPTHASTLLVENIITTNNITADLTLWNQVKAYNNVCAKLQTFVLANDQTNIATIQAAINKLTINSLDASAALMDAALKWGDDNTLEALSECSPNQLTAFNTLTNNGLIGHLRSLPKDDRLNILTALESKSALESTFAKLANNNNLVKFLQCSKEQLTAFNSLDTVNDSDFIKHIEGLDENKIKTMPDALHNLTELPKIFTKLTDKANLEKFLQCSTQQLAAFNSLDTVNDSDFIKHIEGLSESQIQTTLDALHNLTELPKIFTKLTDKANLEKFFTADNNDLKVFNTLDTFNSSKITKFADLHKFIEAKSDANAVKELLGKLTANGSLINIWELLAADLHNANANFDKFTGLTVAEAENYLDVITGAKDGSVLAPKPIIPATSTTPEVQGRANIHAKIQTLTAKEVQQFCQDFAPVSGDPTKLTATELTKSLDYLNKSNRVDKFIVYWQNLPTTTTVKDRCGEKFFQGVERVESNKTHLVQHLAGELNGKSIPVGGHILRSLEFRVAPATPPNYIWETTHASLRFLPTDVLAPPNYETNAGVKPAPVANTIITLHPEKIKPIYIHGKKKSYSSFFPSTWNDDLIFAETALAFSKAKANPSAYPSAPPKPNKYAVPSATDTKIKICFFTNTPFISIETSFPEF